MRPSDLVARMSGDEFNVLLESVDQATANARVQQLAAALAAPYRLDGQEVTVGASIGVVASQPGLASTDDYLRAADAAMYKAKSERMGVCLFKPDRMGPRRVG